MKKRLIALLLILVATACMMGAGMVYFRFVSQTIY